MMKVYRATSMVVNQQQFNQLGNKIFFKFRIESSRICKLRANNVDEKHIAHFIFMVNCV